jgi:hypothetical protein
MMSSFPSLRFKHRRLDDSFDWHTRAEALRRNLGPYHDTHWSFAFNWNRYYPDHPSELDELDNLTTTSNEQIKFYYTTSPPSSPVTFASPSPTPTEPTPEPAFIYLDYNSPLILFHFADVPEVRSGPHQSDGEESWDMLLIEEEDDTLDPNVEPRHVCVTVDERCRCGMCDGSKSKVEVEDKDNGNQCNPIARVKK